MSNTKKILVLANAPINNGNRGCLALSYCAIYLIDDICKQQGIEYELFLTDANILGNADKTIKIDNRSIPFKTCGYPIAFKLKTFAMAILKYKNTLRSWKVFRNADLIFDIGQGDSFADIYGKKRFEIIDRIHRTARFFRKPYILLPQTIGPFTNLNIQKPANKSIAKASWVMARDNISYNYVNENVAYHNNVAEYIDIAFYLPFQKKSFDSKYVHVGLNISALLWFGGYTKDNQFGLNVNYQDLILNIIHYFLSMPNVILHLVPHVVSHMMSIENDYALAFDLQKELNDERIVLSPLFLTPVDAKDYISGLDFFLGARMHATIAAFSSGVSVIPMAYSRKFNGLFIETLNYKYMVDLKQDTLEDAMHTIKSAFKKRAQLKEIINMRLEGVVEEKKQILYQDLRKFLR